MATPSELAFNEGVRALEGQEKQLGDIRSRAVAMFTAGSFVIGFLAPKGFDGASFQFWPFLGALAFGVLAGVTVYVMLPKKKAWKIVLSASWLAEKAREAEAAETEDEFYRTVADHLDRYYELNDKRLAPLYKWLTGAAAMLALEVLAFVVMLATTNS